ncbi:MAG: FHA domain-containing protein [Gammaproteobacteria bacterium]|nr:FHA domain-containing protein [Gammaproteobacteria bacterium]
MVRTGTAFLAGLLIAAARPAASWESLTADLDIDCSQPEERRLDCRFRTLDGQAPAGIRASSGGENLTVEDLAAYPSSGAVSAILFLVDTSDPGRQAVIEKNKSHIRALLSAARSHHRFGLATFDSDLRITAPIGSTVEQVLGASQGVAARGMTTELYRSALGAIDALARVEADRRAIILFSDGQAEDEAYFHQDVVRAAHEAGVIINSLGFPRSVPRSVALQSLRRLSGETGGVFMESDLQFELPDNFVRRQFSAIDSGGRFRVAMDPLSGKPAASREVEIVLQLPVGAVTVRVPVSVGTPAPAAPIAAVQERPAQEPRIGPLPVPARRSGIDLWLWYAVPIALGLLIVLALVTLWFSLRRPAALPHHAVPAPVDIKPLAYLVTQDEKATRYAVRSPVFRIGRSRDNELTLEDSSVSRRHAEIQRSQDGSFMIVDRDSTNGVFVNNERVGRRELHEGDIIEIGDISLRFSASPLDHPIAENTALLHTRAPRA